MPWIVSVTLIVLIPLVLVYWFVGKNLVSAIVLNTGWDRRKVVRWMAVGCGYLNSFPLIFVGVVLLGGRGSVPAFSGESFLLDVLFVYPFWFGLIVVVQAFLFLLLLLLARLLSFPWYRNVKERWRQVEGRLFMGMVAFLIPYSAVVIARDTWTVRTVDIPIGVPQKASGLIGKKIVFVSDVQGDGRTDERELRSYVERINSLHPDMVFFAGDLVTSGERYIESSADIMGRIGPNVVKVAVVGDHDMFSDRDSVVDALHRNGFIIADDSTVTLAVDSTKCSVSLVTNTYMRRPKLGRLQELAAEAARADYRIFLVHQPAEQLVRFAEGQGYNLFLAGHTHGGGVAFGIPGLFLAAPAKLESRYMSGRYSAGSMTVVVTNGLGLTLTPFRFHAPAEITVLTFEARNGRE